MSYPTHRIEHLTSAENPWIKSARRAVSQGELTRDGLCIAEGFRLLDEALRCGRPIAAVFFNAAAAPDVERLSGPLAAARLFHVPASIFKLIAATQTSQGVVSLVLPPSWTFEQVIAARGTIVVLDGVQDPGNAGAIVRSAEAFGASAVLFLKGAVSPFNPKTLRASAGSLFRLPFLADVEGSEWTAAVKQMGIRLYAAMPGGALPVDRADLRGDCVLIFGNEGAGVRPELSRVAEAIRVPTRGVESLNAAVAAGVILYEAWRQRTSA